MSLPEKDVDALIQNYQHANKIIRNRAILLGVFFLIVIGLLHNLRNNERKRTDLWQAILPLEELAKSDSTKHFLDSLRKDVTFWFKANIIEGYPLDRMEYELKKSNYQDKEPIYNLLGELHKQQKELGIESGDYTISVLGTTTTFSDWLYFAPIIMLLLYHDLTVIFLYRKTLREKLQENNIPRWKLGAELFGFEHEEAELPSTRFIRILTSVFIGVLLILPIVPALVGAFYYVSENRQDDIRPFMVIVQWLCPIMMIAELGIIYYQENIFSIRKLIDWGKRYLLAVPTIPSIIFSFFVIGCNIYFYGLITYETPSDIVLSGDEVFVPRIDWPLMLTIFLTTIPLPIGAIILYKDYSSKIGRALRVIGRLMLLMWVFFMVLFMSTLDRFEMIPIYYPGEDWIMAAWIFFLASAALAAFYVWVYSIKRK